MWYYKTAVCNGSLIYLLVIYSDNIIHFSEYTINKYSISIKIYQSKHSNSTRGPFGKNYYRRHCLINYTAFLIPELNLIIFFNSQLTEKNLVINKKFQYIELCV